MKKKIVWQRGSFKEIFGALPKPKECSLVPKGLERAMLDKEILEEWQPDEVSLAEMVYTLETSEETLTNGYANIFYIRDAKGTLWAVDAHWFADDGGWRVIARSVSDPRRWGAGSRVFSRSWPSDRPVGADLILEAAIKVMKEHGYQVMKEI